MKVVLCVLLVLACSAVYAHHVVGTYPAANSEMFSASDTLRIWFDDVPGLGVRVAIEGENAAYSIAYRQAIDDTLLIVPHHFWLVGDRVTVTVTGAGVTRYVFRFTVRVPSSSNTVNPWRTEYNYYNWYPRATAGTDVDQDGLIDLVVLFTDRLGVVRNMGVPPHYDPSTLSWSDGGHPPCDAARTLRTADLDTNGTQDLIISDPIRNRLTIYPNQSGSGLIRFGAPVSIALSVIGPTDFKIADLNGDELPDIVTIGRTLGAPYSRLLVLINHGGLNFEQMSWDVGLDPSAVDITDLNRDGRPDLVVSCRGDRTIELFQSTMLNPLVYNHRIVLANLPSGPDGLIVDNVSPCWRPSDPIQRPDIVVWSRGVHSSLRRDEHQTLDDEPFLYRYCAWNDSGYEPVPDTVSLSGTPLGVTLAAFDGAIGTPDKDWIVIEQMDAGDTLAQMFDDQLNPTGAMMSLASPYAPMLFDVDLDGDLDLFFIDYGSVDPGDEHIIGFYSPPMHDHPTLDFGMTPINGALKTATYFYTNHGAYPLVITGVDIPNSNNVFSLISPTFPETLQAGAALMLTYGFRPPDSLWYGPLESRIQFSGGPGGSGDTLMLVGSGARSVIQSEPPSGTVSTIVLDFGMTEPFGALTQGFQLANQGYYPLNLGYDSSALSLFSLISPVFDSIRGYSITPDSIKLRFVAPANEGVYRECLVAYDSTFFRCDSFGPRNRTIRDSITYCLQAHVVRNSLPRFSFANVFPTEGGSGSFEIHVSDPNSQPWQDSVRVAFLGVHPAGSSLWTNPPSYPEQWNDTSFTLLYSVYSNVPPLGERDTLYFRAWDFQFPERYVDTSWVVRVRPTDDPPRIEPHDTTFTVDEGNLLVAMLRVTDEEHEEVVANAVGLPSGAQDSLEADSGYFRVIWRPTFTEAGTYHFDVIAHEVAHPTLADTAHATIIVQDMLPDMEIVDLHVDPDTINRGGTVLIHFNVREHYGIPVPTPVVVTLKDSLNGAAQVLIMRDFETFPPSGTLAESYNYMMNACGEHFITLQISPLGPDRSAANNYLAVAEPVVCPDIAAGPIVVPAQTHKHGQIPIEVTIEERNGVMVDTAFTATLKVYAAGEVHGVAVFPIASLPAHGQVQRSVTWQADTCNEHRFELVITPPPGWDYNASNDVSERSMNVLCDPFRAFPLPFTPNEDGYNDTLYFSFGDEQYQSPSVNIFSLDGRLVAALHETQDRFIWWLGRDRSGNACPPGPYMYVFEDGDRKVASGIVYVAR